LPYVRPVPIRFENYPDLLFEADHVSEILKVAQLIPQNESSMIQADLYTLVALNQGVCWRWKNPPKA
jgi:hypothetical protein